MGLVVLFKAGIVGGFGFIIAVGIAMALLIPSSKSMQDASIQVSKIPSFLTFVIVFAIGAGLAYWYFSSGIEVSTPAELEKFTIYACLFSLVPSISIVCGAFSYFCDAQKAIQRNDPE